MNELYKALLAAQKNAKGLKKDGTNKFANFDYVSIEEVVATARELLHECNLVFYPESQFVEGDRIIQTYKLVHVPTGEHIPVVRTMIVPDAAKMSPCQAQGAAESYLLKNTLRELLIIPRFDKKEDIDSHDATNNQFQRRQQNGSPEATRREYNRR